MVREANVTFLLRRVRTDPTDQQAHEELYNLIKDELRRMAQRRARGEPLLGTTVLVQEAYVRLLLEPTEGRERPDWENRAHFYRVAARVMRNLRVDYYRRRRRQHPLGAAEQPPAVGTPHRQDLILELDDALTRLEQSDPEGSALVELIVFGAAGDVDNPDARTLSTEQAGALLGWSRAKSYRVWKRALDVLAVNLRRLVPTAEKEDRS